MKHFIAKIFVRALSLVADKKYILKCQAPNTHIFENCTMLSRKAKSLLCKKKQQ